MRLLGKIALLSILLAAGFGYSADMDAEIDYLLDSVRNSDCSFVRNGKAHDSAAAAKHLQMKRKRGRRYYDSAEEFIDRIASSSSWSGEPYRIDCPGQRPVAARDWFLRKLSAFRETRSDDRPQRR